MNHFFKNIPGWFKSTHVEEFSRILSLIKNKSTWVEVGSFKGKSIVFSVVESLKQNKQINFYAIDTWDNDVTGPQMAKDNDVINGTLYESFLKNTESISHLFEHYRMTSIDASNLFDNNSIDVIYIDAAHDYESVSLDWKSWLPKMKSGGIMIFDDCTKNWGVWNAVIDCSTFLNIEPEYKTPLAILKIPVK